MLAPQERQKENLNHAHWRVEFLLCLLDSHRCLRFASQPGWEQKEAEYLKRLAAAQADLDRLERQRESAWQRRGSRAYPTGPSGSPGSSLSS